MVSKRNYTKDNTGVTSTMKKYVIILMPVLLFLLAGCTQKNLDQANDLQTATNIADDTSTNGGNVIEITLEGFNPSTLTIKSGETVTWLNKVSSPSWPASAVHPSHKVYPEAGGCIGSKFDACKSLKQGEGYSFTFNQKGTWKYHDHLSPGNTGTIIVE